MAQTGLTWADLERTPNDGNRYEIIGGELVVSPAAGLALLLSEHDIVIPDTTYARPERVAELFGGDGRGAMGAPDLVAEVSSPSTRRQDLIVKRALYERHGVEEYWFVDRDEECVLVHLLVGGAYGTPQRVGRGEVLRATVAPGFTLEVDELFDEPRG